MVFVIINIIVVVVVITNYMFIVKCNLENIDLIPEYPGVPNVPKTMAIKEMANGRM